MHNVVHIIVYYISKHIENMKQRLSLLQAEKSTHVYWLQPEFNQLIKSTLRDRVYPKMKILSSFSHPHIVPKLYEFFRLLSIFGYFEECLVTVDGSHWLPQHGYKILWKSMATINLPAFFKLSSWYWNEGCISYGIIFKWTIPWRLFKIQDTKIFKVIRYMCWVLTLERWPDSLSSIPCLHLLVPSPS